MIITVPNHAQTKIPRCIDPARIKYSKEKARPVVFVFGDLHMFGKIQPGVDDDVLNELIKEVMEKMGITELDLRNAQMAWERAQRWEYEGAAEEIRNDANDVRTIIGGIPVIGDAIGITDVVREKFNNPDYPSDQAIDTGSYAMEVTQWAVPG